MTKAEMIATLMAIPGNPEMYMYDTDYEQYGYVEGIKSIPEFEYECSIPKKDVSNNIIRIDRESAIVKDCSDMYVII